ncbi:MAG: hypothetical protein JSU68_02765 [Phycisphaerales bacterium]|nr:MAG: hypothetical protein JSU68_02765 [Phycisphaerales bacterium]
MVARSNSANGVAPIFQHTVLFWLLISAAGMMFLPCVLLPVYLDYGCWRSYRAEAEARTQSLAAEAQKNQQIIEALRTDPGVNERVLARDLGYVRPEEEVVSVYSASRDVRWRLPAGLLATGTAEPTREPAVRLRRWEAQIEQHLPRSGWVTVFTEGSSRRLLLVLSGALVVTALVCFPPQRPTG